MTADGQTDFHVEINAPETPGAYQLRAYSGGKPFPESQLTVVPAPGGVDYRTGALTYTVAATKCGTEFLAFVIFLVKRYAGQKICLVCDNGRFHTTKAVQAWLAKHRDQIEVFWLPPYSPSLNLIERLWGHLKRTILANVLYSNLDDLVTAFRKGVRRMTGDRERMGFMFDHDELTREMQAHSCKQAA